MSFSEEYGDLFDIENDYALAHSVGSDFIMGNGISFEFKKRYGNEDWLLQNSEGVGTSLLLPKEVVGKNIFYLITKKWSRYSKPEYIDIKNSIINMFELAKENNITKIAMPKIGCGLDGLDWDIIKNYIIKYIPDSIHVCVKYI